MTEPKTSAREFLEQENAQRTAAYAKDPSHERFLRKFNEYLLDFGKGLRDDSENGIPNIYVMGLPRSGTTLLAQLLTHCLNIAWPTNLAARFWRVPVIGMRLSKGLGLFEEPVRFQSEWGATSGASSLHEFGYFWLEWFQYPDLRIRTGENEDCIDWKGLKCELCAIANEAGKPVLYKNPLPGLHLTSFGPAQPNALFLFVTRSLADVAVSIYEARIARYGSENTWWSLRPRSYEGLADCDAETQIVEQVKDISAVHREGIAAIPENRRFVLGYEDLCHNPMWVVRKVAAWLGQRGHQNIERREVKSFDIRTHCKHPRYAAFEDRLASVENLLVTPPEQKEMVDAKYRK